jgi:hypothetical protein
MNYGALVTALTALSLFPTVPVARVIAMPVGLSMGSGKSQAVATANLAALNAAAVSAQAAGKELLLPPGIIEIYGATGFVIPTGKRSVYVQGSKASHIIQTQNNVPCCTIGDVTGNDYIEDGRIVGIRFSYKNSQSGNSSAKCVRWGLIRNTEIGHIEIGADYNATQSTAPAYIGLSIENSVNALGFFSNFVHNITVRGATQQLVKHTLAGTGNCWFNCYYAQGVTGTPGACAGVAWEMAGTADFFDDIFIRHNLEHVVADGVPAIVWQSCRGTTFIACHFEGIRITGWDPRFAQVSTSQLNFIGGNEVLNLEVPTAGDGLEAMLFAYYRQSSVKGSLTLRWTESSIVDDTLYVAQPNRYSLGDGPNDTLYTVLDLEVIDTGGSNASFVDLTDVQCPPVIDILRGVTTDTTYTMPAGWTLDDIYIKNNTANAVTGGIKIGTSSGGTQVVAAQAVGANANIRVAQSAILINWWAAQQMLYIQDVTAWNSASLDIHIKRSKAW